MARLKGTGKRGRPMGEIRRWARTLNPAVSTGETATTIIVGKVRGKPEYLTDADGNRATVKLPNGRVELPENLYGDKATANVKEQVRLGLRDPEAIGTGLAVGSFEWTDPDGGRVYVYKPAPKAEKAKAKAEKAEVKAEKKTPRKATARKATVKAAK